MPRELLQIENWFTELKRESTEKLNSLDLGLFMEVRSQLLNHDFYIESGQDIKDAARESTIRTFGWPIALVMDNVDEFSPKARNWGIRAEISITDRDSNSYDFWAIRKDGSFFMLKSLFEDQREKGKTRIFFDTRIIRTAETLMYLKNLYRNLGIADEQEIRIGIGYKGFKGRILGAAGNRLIFENRTSEENEFYEEIETTLEELESSLPELVDRFTRPLFGLFDFFEVDFKIVEEIVNKYKKGIVS
ncbi:MAG: hypothetical protein WDZ40_00875 [Candidatus Spechtbacterales bacterium]